VLLLVVALFVIGTGVVLIAFRDQVSEFFCSLHSPTLLCALPDDATDVRHETRDLFPDGIFWLKAQLSRPQFDAYVRKVGLEAHTPTRRYSDDLMWLAWRKERSLSWWNPSSDLSSTYVSQQGHWWTLAKHEAGYLFVTSFNH